MAQTENYLLPQGEDLPVKLIYKEGSSAQTAVAIDLSSGYALRMDIIVPSTKARVHSLVTRAEDAPGTKATVLDDVLSSGAGGTPNIWIPIPRALTLTGGDIATATPTSVFSYDIFLRNLTSDQQFRILKGSLTVDRSSTQWS